MKSVRLNVAHLIQLIQLFDNRIGARPILSAVKKVEHLPFHLILCEMTDRHLAR